MHAVCSLSRTDQLAQHILQLFSKIYGNNSRRCLIGSKAVITGDVTQIDLPGGKKSGLTEAIEVLRNVPDIGIVNLSYKDVVRHELVQNIVRAYEKYASVKEQNAANSRSGRFLRTDPTHRR